MPWRMTSRNLPEWWGCVHAAAVGNIHEEHGCRSEARMSRAGTVPDVSAVDPRQRVIVAYLGSTVIGTLAASLIWGVTTLYLLATGLDIFQVMLVNTAFTVTQVIFEVPTGVVADTIGRKTSYLISIALLVVSTLLYVAAGNYAWGIPGFVGGSILLAIGWTFQTGAVDAWLVDALDHTGWEGPKERVFAWGGIASETSMVVGVLLGGFLGGFDLAWPFLARAALLVACFVFVAVAMRDLGFEKRPLTFRTVGAEVGTVLREGTRYGWRNRVVRPLLFQSALSALFMWYAFYSLQPYLLQALGRDIVWVAAAGTAAGALAGVIGNTLVGRAMRGPAGRRRPGRVLATLTAASGLAALGTGLVGVALLPQDRGLIPFLAVMGFWIAMSFVNGIALPVRQSFINDHVPASQRATVLSLDALFGDIGGTGGQPALGWMSRAVSIPAAWVAGSVLLLASAWPYRTADRFDEDGAMPAVADIPATGGWPAA